MRRRPRILVVDDSIDMLETLRIMLESDGFDVVTAIDGKSGLRAAYEFRPDAVLLDIIMPDMDGFEVCRRLRDMTDIPIVFLTAKSTMDDIVQGLAAGADDYITKPFHRSELLSRIKVCLRRAGATVTDAGTDTIFASDSMLLDCGRRELIIEDKTVQLNPKEFEVLRLLIHHAGKVLSTEAILARVWGSEFLGDQNLVKQYIYRLRQKLEPTERSPRLLHTVRGEGYYFEAE